MTLTEVSAKADALGIDERAKLNMGCQAEGRHGFIASPSELAALPMLSGGPADTWRYCPECRTIFNLSGKEVATVIAND